MMNNSRSAAMIRISVYFILALSLAGCSLPAGLQAVVTLLPPGEPVGTTSPPGGMMTDVPASQDVPDATEVFGGGPLLEKQAPIRNYRFTSEKGTPVLMPAFMHQEMDCGWMGVGGQVFDANEQPVIDLVVLLQGTLNGEIVNLFALTGTATAFGPGGYEFMLADHPVPSENTLYIGLYDSYGNKLSSDIYISTSELCESNLVLVNFKEFYFEDGASVLVPLIIR